MSSAGHQLERVAARTSRCGSIGDPVRLAQILANLLNNAAKYTEPQRAHRDRRTQASRERWRSRCTTTVSGSLPMQSLASSRCSAARTARTRAARADSASASLFRDGSRRCTAAPSRRRARAGTGQRRSSCACRARRRSAEVRGRARRRPRCDPSQAHSRRRRQRRRRREPRHAARIARHGRAHRAATGPQRSRSSPITLRPPCCSISACPGMDGYEVARRIRARGRDAASDAHRAHRLGPRRRPAPRARSGLRPSSGQARRPPRATSPALLAGRRGGCVESSGRQIFRDAPKHVSGILGDDAAVRNDDALQFRDMRPALELCSQRATVRHLAHPDWKRDARFTRQTDSLEQPAAEPGPVRQIEDDVVQDQRRPVGVSTTSASSRSPVPGTATSWTAGSPKSTEVAST